MTPKGEVTEFSAGVTTRTSFDAKGGASENSASPEAITAGPDGNLWFTTGDRIGRITPDGVLSFFGAGVTAGGRPTPITSGCDGNVWFSELGANQIGRIDPGGQGRPALPDACSKKRS